MSPSELDTEKADRKIKNSVILCRQKYLWGLKAVNLPVTKERDGLVGREIK